MKVLKRLFPVVVLVGLVSISVLAVTHRQSIYDWFQLRNYNPPNEVSALASATTMNDYGRRIFYVNHPQLQDKDQFNSSCTESEQSIVLGCYIQRQGIYLFDVKDDRLAGVEEVTSAHEMLHAGYDRLSGTERTKIDALTQQAFDKIDNPRLKKTVEAYRKKDPSIVPNELHSIIGTEVRNIPPELENYYSRYFSNRLSVVAFSEKYEKEFTRREELAATYRQQLESIRKQIDSTNSELQSRADSLASEYSQLEATRSGSEPSEFNARAGKYNTNVQVYNRDVASVGALIDQHNSLLDKYNAVVLEENDLLKAIDSRPSTISTE